MNFCVKCRDTHCNLDNMTKEDLIDSTWWDEIFIIALWLNLCGVEWVKMAINGGNISL